MDEPGLESTGHDWDREVRRQVRRRQVQQGQQQVGSRLRDGTAELAIGSGSRQVGSQGSSPHDATPGDTENTHHHHEPNDADTLQLIVPITNTTNTTMEDIDQDKDSSKKRKRNTSTVAVGSKRTRNENHVPQDGDLIETPSKRKNTSTPDSKKLCSDSSVM